MIKQKQTRVSISFEFRMSYLKGKRTTGYPYKRNFHLKAGIKIELVRKLLWATTETIKLSGGTICHWIKWDDHRRYMIALGTTVSIIIAKKKRSKTSGRYVNLPWDHIRGGDAEIPQRSRCMKQLEKSSWYVARKALNISWPTLPHI